MKQIVTNAVDSNVPCGPPVFVSKEKYYGIAPPFFLSRKGFICRERYDAGKYNAICRIELTNHNDWEYSNDSLAALINDLRCENFTVYEFNTPQELFTWLADR